MKPAYLTEEQADKYIGKFRDRAACAERDKEIDSRPRGRCCVFFVAAQHDHVIQDSIAWECDRLAWPTIQFRNGQYWLVVNGDDEDFCCDLPVHFCPWCGQWKN